MSYTYGKVSAERLATCHPDLQRLFNSLIEDYDVTILCGHRTEAEQNAAFASGASKLKWPNGKHNSLPSRAVDATLHPVQWNDNGRHYMFIGIVKERARQLGISIRCGGDWDGDNETRDQTFNDLVHFELC